MKRYLAIAALANIALAVAPLACAQPLRLEVFNRLKDKASDSSDINLSKDLIGLAGSFLSGGGEDAAKLKRLVEGMNGIRVRSLEFEKEGAYTDADVQALISELAAPGWNLIVSANQRHKNGHEISRIWTKSGTDKELGGLRILTAEPKELSVIEIDGKIRPEDLNDLGSLVPDIGIPGSRSGKKNDEE